MGVSERAEQRIVSAASCYTQRVDREEHAVRDAANPGVVVACQRDVRGLGLERVGGACESEPRGKFQAVDLHTEIQVARVRH